MSVPALLLAAALAAAAPAGCPSPYGEQHRYVACYEAMLRDAEAKNDPAGEARALMQLAWAAWQTSNFEQARERFERAAERSAKGGDDAGEARATNFLGLFLQTQLGDYDGAARHYEKALEIVRRIGDHLQEGEALYHLCFLHLVRRQYAQAISYGERSLEARRIAGDRRGEGITLAALGMACVGLGKTTESLRYQQQALPLIHESGDRRSEADVLDHIGHALTDLGRYDEAIVHHTRALELRRQIRDDFDATLTLANLAAAYRAAGRLSEAAESMKQVIDAVEAARATQSSRTYRGKVLARKLMYYEQFIDLLLEMHQHEPDAGHDAAALHVSERARARLTLDAIEQAHAEGESGLGAARPLTAKEIQEQLLDGETMLLEYSVGDERSVAWSVTRQSLTTHILPKRDTISAAARRLHQLLSAGDQRLRRHDLAEAMDTMSRLALNDVTLPKYVRRIVIVADGALQYVPFSLLHLRGSSQPLIERVEIVTAPSASTVVAMRRLVANRPSQHGIAVFADPVFGADDERLDHGRRAARPAATRGGTTLAELSRLPYTRNEAESILRLAPRGSLRALGFEARREAVVSADLAGFDVIHFATHAIVDAERTGIVLSLLDAHGRNVNGMIALQDVFSLRLGASLVVLSACRTALGSDLRGEGMVSLVRAFMHAGVPRVAATYWDVKDASTAALMRSFYRAMLVDHLPPAAALRSAQLEMLRGGRWRAPHHWAAFTLQGDWR